MDKRKERTLNEMQKNQLQAELIEAINKIDIVVPDTVKELGLPASKVEDIVKEIKFEEFGEKIKKAKAEILKASRIHTNPEAKKLQVDFKNLYRQLVFKEFQLKSEVLEKDESVKSGLKPKWRIHAERDMVAHQLSNVQESLELYGVDTYQLTKEVDGEYATN